MLSKVTKIVALLLVGVMTRPTMAEAQQSPKSTGFGFAGWGYVCVRTDRTLLVDTPQPPTCSTAVGVSLPALPRSFVPKIRVRQANGWSVSQKPMSIAGSISSGSIRFTSVAVDTGRADRAARSLATVEVASFEMSPADAQRDPNAIFEQLPLLAAAAPNATVRLARIFTGTGFRYGAQVRDPAITPTQRASLEAVGLAQRISISVNTTPAVILATECTGLPASTAQLVGFGVDVSSKSPRWPNNPTRWIATKATCDELSQVQIVQAPVVGSLGEIVRPDTDTVVDATIRINQAP
jgi:hypothetical protein